MKTKTNSKTVKKAPKKTAKKAAKEATYEVPCIWERLEDLDKHHQYRHSMATFTVYDYLESAVVVAHEIFGPATTPEQIMEIAARISAETENFVNPPDATHNHADSDEEDTCVDCGGPLDAQSPEDDKKDQAKDKDKNGLN